jgi:hypothetical protein
MSGDEAPGQARYAAYLHRRWLWRRGLDRTLAGIEAATYAREGPKEPSERRDGESPASGTAEQ